jgi:hypothetical protein
MVPCTTVPFLSSIVTVSLAHFMRNLFEEGLLVHLSFAQFVGRGTMRRRPWDRSLEKESSAWRRPWNWVYK